MRPIYTFTPRESAMPLETATYINQLVSTNPAGTDGEAQGDDHLRLIKACLQATFPNFTAAALNSTQSAIDAVTTAYTNGTWPISAGTVGAPSLHLAADATTGVYSTGVGHVDVAVGGVQLLDMSSVGLNLVTGALQFAGVNVFPLASTAYGAGSILTAAIGASQVTYAKLQNESATTLLGNPTGGATAPSEVTLDSNTLAFSGTALQGLVKHAASKVTNLLVVNDGTTPNTKLDVTADEAVLVDTSGKAFKHTAVSVVIDSTVTGANGCDVGTRALNTNYDVYLISNGTTVAGLLVIEGNTPSMPSGYTFKKRISWQRTDASSNFLKIRQAQNKLQYVLQAASNFPVIASGVQSTFAAKSLVGFCPAWAFAVTIGAQGGSNGGPTFAAPNPNYANTWSNTSATPIAPVSYSCATNDFGNQNGTFVLETPSTVYYSATGGSSQIVMMGCELPL